MNNTVHKFGPIYGGSNTVPMPKGAEILKVGEQNGRIFLWARINPSEPVMIHRTIHMVPTGLTTTNVLGTYIDSLLLEREGLVFHVFETK